MGMRLVAGRDFSREYPTDTDAVVVNEEFVKQFEIEEPIGMRIGRNSPQRTIIGVVENYHYRSLQHEIESVMHWLDTRYGARNLLVRISTQNIGNTLSVLENLWKEIQPDKPFDYTFFDEDLALRYQDERRWNSIVLYSSVLSILITCLGLIGITTITISRRIKEIGIRKVLGASVTQITRLLVNEFLLLVFISNILTWPIGYYFMNKWLQNFAYRTNMGLDIFLFSGVLAFVIAILTISYQAFKAATGNPVDALKCE